MTQTVNYQLDPMGNENAYRVLMDALSARIPYELTPYYVETGQTLIVHVSEGSEDVSLRVGFANQSENDFLYNLTPGVNYVNIQNDGMLSLSNQSWDTQTTIDIEMPSDVRKLPTFFHNQSSQDEFMQEIADNPDLPIQLIGENTAVILDPGSDGIQYLTDPNATIERLETTVLLEDEMAGYRATPFGNSSDSVFENQTTFFIETDNFYMYTGGKGISYYNGTYPGVMLRLLDPYGDGRLNLSTGVWHENGHMHQMDRWILPGHGETAPNIYMMHATAAGAPEGFRSWPSDSDTANEVFAASPSATTWSEAVVNGSSNAQLIYSQLYAAFGKNFYSNLSHYYRTLSTDEYNTLVGGSPVTLEGKSSLFVRVASEQSGYDLTSFFDSWKWPMTDADRAYIESLNLNAMPIDLANFPISTLAGEPYPDFILVEEADFGPNPQAEVDGFFITVNGSNQLPDLTQYVTADPSVVKVELLNPATAEANYNVKYGTVSYEVLLEDADGNRNVVALKTLVLPSNYAEPTEAEIIRQANLALETGNVPQMDIAAEMLEFVTTDPSATDLLNDIRHRLNEADRLSENFVDSFQPTDVTVLDAAQGTLELRVNKDLLDAVTAQNVTDTTIAPSGFRIQVLNPATGRYANLAEFRNGNLSSASPAPTIDGEDYVFSLDTGFAFDDTTVFRLYPFATRFNNEESALFGEYTEYTKSDFSRVGDVDDPISIFDIDEWVNNEDIIVNEDSYALSISADRFAEITEQGELVITAYKNDEVLGTSTVDNADIHTDTGNLQMVHDAGSYNFTVDSSQIYMEDDIRFTVEYKADSENTTTASATTLAAPTTLASATTLEPDTTTTTTEGSLSGTTDVNVEGAWITQAVRCFTPGMKIETDKGEVAIENLKLGDLVRTVDHGLQPIRFIKSRKMVVTPKNAPVIFETHTVNNVERLVVSPGHRFSTAHIPVENRPRFRRNFGNHLVAAFDLVNGTTIRRDNEAKYVEYFHMMFDNHELVYCQGSISESWHPIVRSVLHDLETQEEIFEIFPELRKKSPQNTPLVRPLVPPVWEVARRALAMRENK